MKNLGLYQIRLNTKTLQYTLFFVVKGESTEIDCDENKASFFIDLIGFSKCEKIEDNVYWELNK